MLAIDSLWVRELLRFLRRPNCSLSALALPAILFLGSDSLRPASYVLVASFTLILATLAAVDDPADQFLQGVHTSPAPRISIVLAKALAGVTLAVLNGLVLGALHLL
ncbi:MAG: hypothetical protein ABI665_24950 [Vicinamibacterales bacterium]